MLPAAAKEEREFERYGNTPFRGARDRLNMSILIIFHSLISIEQCVGDQAYCCFSSEDLRAILLCRFSQRLSSLGIKIDISNALIHGTHTATFI
jgi:hypothetical protein